MTDKTKKLIKTLAQAPDNQIDAPIRRRIENLQWCDGPSARVHMKQIIDECVVGSCATDFSVACLMEMHRRDDFWV